MGWPCSHVWCNTSSPDRSQIYCSEISGAIPDSSHWRNALERLRTLLDRLRNKGPSHPRLIATQSSARCCCNGAPKTPRPSCHCFCLREVSFVPSFSVLPPTYKQTAPPSLSSLRYYCTTITLVPVFLPAWAPVPSSIFALTLPSHR